MAAFSHLTALQCVEREIPKNCNSDQTKFIREEMKEHPEYQSFFQDLFCREIVGPIQEAQSRKSPPLWTYEKKAQAVQIDGFISTEEEYDLYSRALDILEALSWKSRSDLKLVIALRQNYTQAFSQYLEIDSSTLEALSQLLQATMPLASPSDLIVLEYVLRENLAAQQRGGMAFAARSDKNWFGDISASPDFQSFAETRKYLPPALLRISVSQPVDYLASNPEAPVLIVYLDRHTDIGMQAGILEDWIQFSRYEPYYGLEGYEHDKGPDFLLQDVYESIFKDKTYPEAYRKALKNLNLTDQALQMKLEYPQTIPSFTLDEIKGMKNSANNDWNSIVLFQQLYSECSSRDLSAKKNALMSAAFIPYFSEDGSGEFFQEYLTVAHDCLYHGFLKLQGWENGEVHRMEFENQVLKTLTMTARSQIAYDNSLRQMEKSGKNLGILKIGRAHYGSLRKYAQERGLANLIFLYTPAYKGPPSSPPHQCGS